MHERKAGRGVTLIELVVTLSVLAILVTIGAPQMRDFIEKRRVVGAAEQVKDLMLKARSEAIKQSTDIFVTVCPGDGEAWVVGASDDDAADCTNQDFTISQGAVDGSVVPVTTAVFAANNGAANFPGVATDDSATLSFTARGVLADPADTGITLANARWALRVNVNPLGRARLCWPGDAGLNPGGYEPCGS